jgi:hypothetical protein
VLEKFSSTEEFVHYFDGKRIVHIYTATKEQLEGTLTLKDDGRVLFTSIGSGLAGITKGGILLIVPQITPTLY